MALERSAIGWQQHISRALGCNPGQLTYQLEECIEKIEGLKPRTVNSAAEAEALAEGSVILTGGVASIALTDLNQPVRVWDAGRGAQCTTDRLTFPATVLFTPGDAG